ncbi:MAG: hypothetical protein QM820_50770 [Minicystis sp.]
MTSDRPTARELELVAAAEPLPSRPPPLPSPSEALAMLVRRGFAPTLADLDLPFPADLPDPLAERLADALDHYAFRLFLRGAIHHRDGFLPEEATRFLSREHAEARAAQAASLGLLTHLPGDRYGLVRPCASFGGTLEWYVARRLAARYALDAVAGVKFHAPGVGGDLDVLAAGEGRLISLELKSSPPKHIAEDEVGAFLDRLRVLRPHVAIFAVDTALRLADKVVPLFAEVAARRGKTITPRRVERELWALSPHLYVVNAKPDSDRQHRPRARRGLARALARAVLATRPRTRSARRASRRR